MLRLRKIKRDKEFIEAYYTPENCEGEGFVKIRLSDGETVESKLSELDREGYAPYFHHAERTLDEMKDAAELPQERLVMWY